MTRHSLGQVVIDALATRLGIRMVPGRKGITGHGIVTIGETPVSVTLFKSKAYMNVSGPSIVEAYRTTVKTPTSMIVLQDSLSHRVEQVSARLGGSANGHNGIKSIIAAMGGEQRFYRFRLGIGEASQTDTAAYVMGKLSSRERQFWNDEGVDLVLEEIEKVVLKANAR
ncbi:peptidyl-tRNA hydrolase [Dendrothele bispora CBS 962.96]|uniref:peptidyl-tRNA hydrolase n=1 Tax=Dendrothele bispora (strain CBS 962.96) TaxID=1314807 RepID=A0A4S8MU57_DENBC|nr:peptidyl-tRNA hydrolase [Dendrothele bispora CBS 962.96]